MSLIWQGRISFSKTEPQFLDGSKTVTRRLGWEWLRGGERLRAVRQAMGLKKGEKQVVIGAIEVLSARREPLNLITDDDVRREGFPDKGREWFIEFFCKAFDISPKQNVTRIEFRRMQRTAKDYAAGLIAAANRLPEKRRARRLQQIADALSRPSMHRSRRRVDELVQLGLLEVVGKHTLMTALGAGVCHRLAMALDAE